MNSCTNDPEMDCDGCDKVMVVYSNEGVGCVFKEDSKVKTMMNESEEIKTIKINWKCFFGFHNFTQNKDFRFCVRCGGKQESYRCGASDTWQWRWI